MDLARDLAGQRSAGFVNAVLRKVATRDLETWMGVAAPRRDADPLGHLAVRYSHPRWMVQVVAGALGEDATGALAETEAALAADGIRPRVTLCVVPGLADPGELHDHRRLSPLPGHPLGPTWRAGTRPRSRRSAPGAPPSRTRRASWPRSRWPGPG